MRIHNHSGIFRVEKRLREFGNFKLPGDGITYAQLVGGLAGVIIASPAFLLAFFLTSTIIQGIISQLITWLVAIIIAAGVAFAGSFQASLREQAGESPINSVLRSLRWRRMSKRIVDGDPFTPASYKYHIEAVVDAR